MAYNTLSRRNVRTEICSLGRGDQRMIRYARSGFHLTDTVTPERPETSDRTVLAGMLLVPFIPLVTLLFTLG